MFYFKNILQFIAEIYFTIRAITHHFASVMFGCTLYSRCSRAVIKNSSNSSML